MGKRSRKRGGGTIPAPAPAGAPRRPAAPRRDERPRAPWHPFPLVELCVLGGLVMLVWGVIRRDDDLGRALLVGGMALASLGGLDTALREHFGGVKSHAVLLAALPAVLSAGVLYFAAAPWIALPLVAAALFGAALTVLQRTFRRRS
jgi:hypothetical protein